MDKNNKEVKTTNKFVSGEYKNKDAFKIKSNLKCGKAGINCLTNIKY